MRENEKEAPDTITPSEFVYIKRNELRDAYARQIKHAVPMIKSSMIIAYTRALDDVTKLLHEKDKEMAVKRANT